MRPTVHDLAIAAGVSLATVDRVLNRRPGVKATTRTRVEDAIARIGFVRDVASANLAKGRVYPFVFIVPDGDNSFMAGLRAEIVAAQMRSPAERTDIRLIGVPAFDSSALAAALASLVAEPPAGVCLVAIDAPEVEAAVAALKARDVAVVTLVSDLAASEREHFCGVDNLAAGRTAGALMGRFLGGRTGSVAVIAGSMRVRDHRDRLEGFAHRLGEIHPGISILPVSESQDDPERVRALVATDLAEVPDLVGIYNLGAGNRGLLAAMESGPSRGPRPVVVAHELTRHTRRGLEEGIIDAILNQDAGHEVRSAIRVMKAQADGVAVIEAQERIRIDIFLKDNLP